MGALCAALVGAAAAGASTVSDASSRLEAARWREDLRHLAAEMPKVHRNLFHATTRAAFQSAVAALDERIPSLARHQIIVEMARIVASIGDGHTNVAPTRDPKIAFRGLPIRLYLFKDGLFVRAATKEHVDLVGCRVLRIGDASVDEAYAAVRDLIGRDNEMGARFFAPFLLAMPEVLHAVGLAESVDRARFLVDGSAGPRAVELAPAGPFELLAPDTDTSWMPREGWIDARDAPPPLWLRNPLDKHWFEVLPDGKSVYVQFNQVGNDTDESVEAFTERLFETVSSRSIEKLVLDLRLNRGGNAELNRPLFLGIVRATPIDQKGRLFTLVGRSTWSAAQMLTDLLDRYTNTLLVGEPTASRENAFGDSAKIVLPNSGITVRASTLWWQGDERDRRQWTAPDVSAELTFADYRANRDPALEAALAWVPTKSLAEVVREGLKAGGEATARARYRAWKVDPANAWADTEEALNGLGYELLGAGRVGSAIAIFELNVAEHPESPNVHDSLGEALAMRGDTAAAIASYERALALDPRSRSAAEALRKLRRR